MLVSDTQKCDSVIHILVHASILLRVIFPFRLFHNNELSSLCYIIGLYLIIKCCGQFYNIGDCCYSNQLLFLMWNLYPRILYFSSVQFSRSVVSDSWWPREPQHTRPPCPSPTPGVYPNSCHWVGDAIQPSHLLSSPSPPALNISQHHGLFKRVNSPHQVAKVLEFQLQHQSYQ